MTTIKIPLDDVKHLEVDLNKFLADIIIQKFATSPVERKIAEIIAKAVEEGLEELANEELAKSNASP